jgi:regulatory protein
MHIVSDIKRQKRSGGRYDVYIDDVVAFSMNDLDLSTLGVRVGLEVDQKNLDDLRKIGESSLAYNLAIVFLRVRARTKREMFDYLRRKGTNIEAISDTLERLEEAGLVDDRAFSVSWIANRAAIRPRSKWMLEQELRKKGVSSEYIKNALSDIAPESELDSLVKIIKRKHQQSQYREPRKLMAYLSRQGYSYELIKVALDRLGLEI